MALQTLTGYDIQHPLTLASTYTLPPFAWTESPLQISAAGPSIEGAGPSGLTYPQPPSSSVPQTTMTYALSSRPPADAPTSSTSSFLPTFREAPSAVPAVNTTCLPPSNSSTSSSYTRISRNNSSDSGGKFLSFSSLPMPGHGMKVDDHDRGAPIITEHSQQGQTGPAANCTQVQALSVSVSEPSSTSHSRSSSHSFQPLHLGDRGPVCIPQPPVLPPVIRSSSTSSSSSPSITTLGSTSSHDRGSLPYQVKQYREMAQLRHHQQPLGQARPSSTSKELEVVQKFAAPPRPAGRTLAAECSSSVLLAKEAYFTHGNINTTHDTTCNNALHSIYYHPPPPQPIAVYHQPAAIESPTSSVVPHPLSSYPVEGSGSEGSLSPMQQSAAQVHQQYPHHQLLHHPLYEQQTQTWRPPPASGPVPPSATSTDASSSRTERPVIYTNLPSYTTSAVTYQEQTPTHQSAQGGGSATVSPNRNNVGGVPYLTQGPQGSIRLSGSHAHSASRNEQPLRPPPRTTYDSIHQASPTRSGTWHAQTRPAEHLARSVESNRMHHLPVSANFASHQGTSSGPGTINYQRHAQSDERSGSRSDEMLGISRWEAGGCGHGASALTSFNEATAGSGHSIADSDLLLATQPAGGVGSSSRNANADANSSASNTNQGMQMTYGRNAHDPYYPASNSSSDPSSSNPGPATYLNDRRENDIRERPFPSPYNHLPLQQQQRYSFSVVAAPPPLPAPYAYTSSHYSQPVHTIPAPARPHLSSYQPPVTLNANSYQHAPSYMAAQPHQQEHDESRPSSGEAPTGVSISSGLGHAAKSSISSTSTFTSDLSSPVAGAPDTVSYSSPRSNELLPSALPAGPVAAFDGSRAARRRGSASSTELEAPKVGGAGQDGSDDRRGDDEPADDLNLIGDSAANASGAAEGAGTKIFECPGCDLTFTRLSALKQHMLSHTGEKPHACKHCGRRFSLASNLRRHTSTKACKVLKFEAAKENVVGTNGDRASPPIVMAGAQDALPESPVAPVTSRKSSGLVADEPAPLKKEKKRKAGDSKPAPRRKRHAHQEPRWIPRTLAMFKNAHLLTSTPPFQFCIYRARRALVSDSGDDGDKTDDDDDEPQPFTAPTMPLHPVRPSHSISRRSIRSMGSDDSSSSDSSTDGSPQARPLGSTLVEDEYEERNSYEEAPEYPYHPASWHGRFAKLPGPGLLPGDELTKHSSVARRWMTFKR